MEIWNFNKYIIFYMLVLKLTINKLIQIRIRRKTLKNNSFKLESSSSKLDCSRTEPDFLDLNAF